MSSARAILFAVLWALLWPLQAGAALGGPAASVEVDQARMKAVREAKAEGSYTVHEMTLPSGTVVREFESAASGKIFAVAWRGPFMPDLAQLLGDNFASFKDAAGQRGMGRGRVRVDQSTLVVRSSGHMRAFAGMAYIPQQLPEGMSVEDIR